MTPKITFLTKQDQEHGPFVIGSSELLDLVIIGWITLESYIVNTKFDKMEKKSFKWALALLQHNMLEKMAGVNQHTGLKSEWRFQGKSWL